MTCQHAHRIAYTDEGGLYQRCQICGYETLNYNPIPERTTMPTIDPYAEVRRLDLAITALTDLYDAWHRDGGTSPDTADESRAVAEAVGSPEVTDPAVLEIIWTFACEGAEIGELANAHLAAIDEVG